MRVDIEPLGDILLARVSGELDLRTAPEFRDTVDGALERDYRDINLLLLSMAGVTFLDSSGLGAVLGRYRRLSQRGGRVVVCSLPHQISKVFELAGLFKLIDAFDTEADAIAALRGGGAGCQQQTR
ncbi:MAG TPA: anti-sigma factor antagonist [Firmicutes bacterium]|nr:anti-sigma factor antagonist [Bacillota bacterium]